jgi:RNA polymerase sigma-70 factor (ECF subfamily)
MNTHQSIAGQHRASDFGRTRWSMVAAVREGTEGEARRSLGELCRRYWVPVYAYVRRSGYSAEEAVQLVQTFLNRLVARLRVSQPQLRGGFRDYMQAQLEEFLSGDPRSDAPEHFAGLEPPWPLAEIEQRQRAEHAPDATPAEALQRGFALELLAIALQRLRREAEQSGRDKLFEAVRPYLSREPSQADYLALAKRMSSSALAMVVAVKRLRGRFQELVDDELAQTVGNAESLQNERKTLLSLAAPPVER